MRINLVYMTTLAVCALGFSASIEAAPDYSAWRQYDPPGITRYTGVCPTEQIEFGRWVQQRVSEMKSPDEINQVNGWVKQCLSGLPGSSQPAAARCSASLAKMGTTFPIPGQGQEGLQVAPAGDTPVSRPVDVPPILSDRRFLRAVREAKRDPATLDRILKELAKSLPDKSRIVKFRSGSSHAWTVTITIPGQTEDVYFHYIGEGPQYYTDKQGRYIIDPKTNQPIEIIPHGDIVRVPKSSDGRPNPFADAEFISLENKENGTPQGASHQFTNSSWCLSCHRHGSRAIVPIDGNLISFTPDVSPSTFMHDFDKARPVFSSTKPGVSYEKLGPQIGGQNNRNPAQQKDFIINCAKADIPNIANNPGEIDTLTKKMNCVGCHDEGNPNMLRFPMDVREFSLSTFNNVILRGHMPQSETPLKEPERRALLACLKQDYFGGFQDRGEDGYWSAGGTAQGVLMRYLTENCDEASMRTPVSAAAPAAGNRRAPRPVRANTTR